MQDFSAFHTVPVLISLSFMAASIYSDLHTRRIPNLLTVPFACGGMMFHCAAAGLQVGGLYALKGLVLGYLLLLIPFILGGMGGGDVKCLGALGAWMGPERIFWIFLYGAMAGGLLALALLLRYHRGEGIWGLILNVKEGLMKRPNPHSPTIRNSFPYTVSITLGLITFFLLGRIVP